jgi:hypothetical protein
MRVIPTAMSKVRREAVRRSTQTIGKAESVTSIGVACQTMEITAAVTSLLVRVEAPVEVGDPDGNRADD